jgi:RNA 3'-terminal phosphate cyclase (ATP)
LLEIDGARYSGSGAIVRQAFAYAALTGKPIRVFNARSRRPRPGLRPQHIRVIESIRELVSGSAEGVRQGSTEIVFRPGKPSFNRRYVWDIGSAGSTTALALALLPVIAFAPEPVEIELQGGLFQDFAPSYFHLKLVIMPLLQRMGIETDLEMVRPGYVPRGQGILRLGIRPAKSALRPLVMETPGSVARLWGIALSSHLEDRKVSDRMAEAAKKILSRAGYEAEIEIVYENKAVQPGAALAAFADLTGGARLGADLAGAPRRRSESIGRDVARQLLEELRTQATLDRHASDQIIPFASLASGESRFAIAGLTDHVQSAAWLSSEFLGADVRTDGRLLVIRGIGYRP